MTVSMEERTTLLDKLDLGTDAKLLYKADYQAPSRLREVLSFVFSPIVLILVAWIGLFCLYGRHIISAAAALAR